MSHQVVKPRSAYIHVPFCIHRCGYCDFTVIAGRDDLIGSYLDCLEKEISSQLQSPQQVNTLFIGGGTPSLLSAEDLQRLMTILNHWLPVVSGGELTVECNPDQFTTDRMQVLHEGGVNRISLGVQSFDSAHLQTLERSHTAERVEDVVIRLKQCGLDNFSFDLIFAVPGQTVSEWELTLDQAIRLSPKHVSTYGLTYEKGTAFWTRRKKKLLTPVAEEIERTMYESAIQRLTGSGYSQYEISNFAQAGWESRHNQVYWQGKDYYGFGPGAASFINGVRAVHYRSVTAWLDRVAKGESAVAEQEVLDHDLRSREAVFLGLRQIAGIHQGNYQQQFGFPIRDLAPEAYDQLVSTGLLNETETHLQLTYEGRFLADTVVAEFL